MILSLAVFSELPCELWQRQQTDVCQVESVLTSGVAVAAALTSGEWGCHPHLCQTTGQNSQLKKKQFYFSKLKNFVKPKD